MNMSTITGALFAICAFVYLGIQIYVGGTAASIMYDIDSAGRGPSDPFDGAVDIVNNTQGSDERLKASYVTMAAYNDIDASRTVRAQIFVPIRKLLIDGEKAPNKDFVDVFLSARAPFVGEEECKLLLKTIASACKVEYSTGKLAHDSRKIGSFSVVLSFVPKVAFGDFDQTKKQYFVDFSSELTGNGSTRRMDQSTLSRFAVDRSKAYRKAAKKCAEVRRREGTCAINGIGFRANWSEKRQYISYAATAQFALLSPRAAAVKSASK